MKLPEPLKWEKRKVSRVVAEIVAMEKSGKTHFALTAPGPLLYADLNNRSEGTIEKFLKAGKVIYSHKISMVTQDDKGRKLAAMQEHSITETKKDMEALLELLFETAQGKHGLRSVIIDSWDEFRAAEVVRLYGRVQAVKHEYAKVNRTCREVIEAFKSSDVNLVLITQLRKEMQGKAEEAFWTGKYERKGLYDTGALVHIVLQTDFDEKTKLFTARVEANGYDQKWKGKPFEEPANTFPLVMANLVPDTSPADWS